MEVPISFKRNLTPSELRELQGPVTMITTTTTFGSGLTQRSHFALLSTNDHIELLRYKSERIVMCFVGCVAFLLTFAMFTSNLCVENSDWYK